jgi:hypothetical protein
MRVAVRERRENIFERARLRSLRTNRFCTFLVGKREGGGRKEEDGGRREEEESGVKRKEEGEGEGGKRERKKVEGVGTSLISLRRNKSQPS